MLSLSSMLFGATFGLSMLVHQASSSQTVYDDKEPTSANKASIAPVSAHVSSSSSHSGTELFEFETAQLTKEALANVKGLEPTNVKDLLAFAESPGSKPCSDPPDRPACKAYPGTPEWPSEATWEAFDKALGGALIKTVPFAAPCFNSWPTVQDNATCAFIRQNWGSFRLQVDHPSSASFPLFEGGTCTIGHAPAGNCTLGGYPTYVVNATTVAQIQLAVNFARNSNLRLVIKNKGHDYNAKSTGGGGLSIFTNYLRDIRYMPNYSRAKYNGPALRVGVGAELGSLYDYSDTLNLTIVGGLGRTIGLAGGYSQGGGHSPVSSLHGLGADQILSFEVVLPDGSFVTVNEEEGNHPDLYWALRGGGGSTFGVVTSAIIAVYPTMPVATLTYTISNSSPNSTDTFWAAIREFYQTFVSNADTGQYVCYRLSCEVPAQPWNCSLTLLPHWANNMTVAQLQTHTAPYFAKVAALGIPIKPTWTQYPSIVTARDSSFREGQTAGSMAGFTHTASRLFPRRNWEDPALFNTTFAAIRYTMEVTSGRMQAFNFKIAKNPGLNQTNAAHPAWRETVNFAMLGHTWGTETPTVETITAYNKRLVEYMQPLRDVSPGAGSYLNEGDINEPNFQQAFYGENYARLYALKQKYDPTGTLFAHTAVGSEDWYMTDQVPYYPTSNGRLCRKK